MYSKTRGRAELVAPLGCCRDTPSPPPPHDQNFGSPLPGIGDVYSPGSGKPELPPPGLVHRWKSSQSIMSLAVDGANVFAGTQTGQILVYSLETYQFKRELTGHRGSVYCLILTQDCEERYLISGSSDSLLKVWDIDTFEEVFTIYSVHDIGDIFSVAWAPLQQTVYFGAQNASIQWIKVQREPGPTNDPSGLPAVRFDKFFDSRGPGGKMSPQQSKNIQNGKKMTLLEVLPSDIVKFAHNGYVHSMFVTVLNGCNREVLVSGAGDGTVKIWGLEDRRLTMLRCLELETSILSMTKGSESFLYCGLTNGQVVMYDIDTSQVVRVDNHEASDIMTLTTVGDCVFKGTSGLVQKWDPFKYSRSEWLAHAGLTLAAVASKYRGSNYLVTGGNDSTVAVWDISRLAKSQNSMPKQSVVALDNDNMIKTLGEFVSYKTVSGQESCWSDCRRCASYLRSLFHHFGAESQLLGVEPNGNPTVYGCFKGKDRGSNKKSRILFYGHYDVIIASRSDKWDTDPFGLTALNGYLYGRGVSDNKGPVLAAIFAVAELVQSSQLENDVVFLIEGEEECGSGGFKEAVLNHKDLIGDIDWILLSNSYWLDDKTPCLNYGLRGVINASVTIESDRPDLHSGVHGGVYREPTIDLVNLLAKLTCDKGRVLVPRFYESVRDINPDEEQLYEAIIRTSGMAQDKETLMRKWRYPSLTVHRIKVSGPGNTTVIPASVKATISLRIVPDQDIEQIKESVSQYLVESFEQFESDNTLTVVFSHEAEPWLGFPFNEAFQILRRALNDEWGVDPLFIREGGSIPVVRLLEKIFDAPAAQLPCGQASDGAHLNNERLRVTNFFKTRNVLKKAFLEL
jgi:di- and tripeptidase